MTVYGRLDVYWPDGKFDTYVLEKPVVSIGRAEGNTVMLDTDELSRYHFSINRDDNKVVSITDLGSANGTFIDGVQLAANQPRVLEGVEEIQAGSLRMIYQPGDDSPTMPTPTISDETTRIERPDCRLELDMSTIDVWPASNTAAELAITNISLEPKRYSIHVTGMSDKWLRINRPDLEVYPGETAAVLLNVKPPRHSEVVPAVYYVTIHVAPADKPEGVMDVPLTVNLHGYSGLGIALGTKHIEAGDSLRLYLHNQGNEPLTLKLYGSDPANALRFSLPTAPMTLAAGQRLQITGTMSAVNRPMLGAPRDYEFHLHVKAQNAAQFLAVVGGKVTVRPLLPTWAAITLAGIIVSMVIVAGLLLTGILNPPVPVINELQVNADQIAQGTPLVISWDTENAAALSLRVNGETVASPEGSQTGYEVSTSGLHGDVSIELIAENGGRTDTAVRRVFVYQPMRVERFIVTPDSLVSNTVGSLSLDWDVPGAVRVTIGGLENTDFARSPQFLPSYGASGSLKNLTGIATTSLVITLDAEDEVGNHLQQVVTVDLLESQCTATADITLYEAPDARSNTVGSLKNGVQVVVDRQAGNPVWLRVPGVGGVNGWAASAALDCDFNIQTLQQEVITFTPVPTSPPATAAPTQPPPTRPVTAATPVPTQQR